MRRVILKLAMWLVIAAPLVGQTPPAPPAPAAPAAPKRAYRVTVATGRAFLGVEPRDVTPDRVAALKLKNDKGVEITSLDQDAPAGKAGLKEHDVILTFNGTAVEDSDALRKLIRDTPPGKTVALGISRDGQPMTVNVTLADRNKVFGGMMPAMPAMPHLAPMPPMPPMPDMSDMPSIMVQFVGRNGIMVEGLTSQLGDFFGVKNGEGVLVRSVEKGSPGESAGLKAGDVIVKVGSDRIADTGDWRAAIRTHQGQTVQLGIIRDRREMSLSLAVPPRRQSGVPSSSNFNWDFDLDAVNGELDRIGPEIDRATKVDMAQLQKQLELHRKDFDRTSKIEMKELQRELQKAQKLSSEEFRKQMQELQRDMEKMRKDLQRQFHEIDYQ